MGAKWKGKENRNVPGEVTNLYIYKQGNAKGREQYET